MLTIIATIIAYLIGSVSSAVIICKLLNQPDPRTAGSENAGATNVQRLAGNKAALITLGADIAKGLLAILVARLLFQHGLELGVVLLAVVAGHIYPLFFKFKGGKGVATAFGALIAISPLVAVTVAVSWIVIAFIFRYSSLASLIAAVLAPVYALFLSPAIYFIAIIPTTLLIFWRHRANIERLRAGTEPKMQLFNK